MCGAGGGWQDPALHTVVVGLAASSPLLVFAEEQGHGISSAAFGPPGHPLPSPALSTHHLLRRPPTASNQASGHTGRCWPQGQVGVRDQARTGSRPPLAEGGFS